LSIPVTADSTLAELATSKEDRVTQIAIHPPAVLIDRVVPSWSRSHAGSAVLVLAGALLVGILAQIRVPLAITPVPMSGQTFGVLLVGASLGAARGALSLGLYLLLGLVGVPVFAGGNSGIEYAIGATSGYLVGFVFAAAVIGYSAERQADRRMWTALPGLLIATLVIYICGTAGIMLVVGTSLPRAVELGVLPFLVGDLVKAILAGVLLPAAWMLLGDTWSDGPKRLSE
jgi:biotin transport system substrate-specific component